ncbi:MAG: OmpA family protein [Pseudomonadales bacterium]|nr:OmpA family protein [Pseudomonadales bacterium]
MQQDKGNMLARNLNGHFKLRPLAEFISRQKPDAVGYLRQPLLLSIFLGALLNSQPLHAAGQPEKHQRVIDKAGETYLMQRRIQIIEPLRFRLGRSEIRSVDIDILKRALRQLKGRPNLRLEVVGHTDNIRVSNPSTLQRYGDNLGLSKARADRVADYLRLHLNVPDVTIVTTGMADKQPLATNSTSDGRARNRRVEVQIAYDELAEYENYQLEVEKYTDLAIGPSNRYATGEAIQPGNGAAGGPGGLNSNANSHDIWLSKAPATRLPRLAFQAQQQLLLLNSALITPLVVQVDTNFPDYIASWQLEIFSADDLLHQKPLAIVQGQGSPAINKGIVWKGKDASRSLANLAGISYRLRLRDAKGREALTHLQSTDFVADPRLMDFGKLDFESLELDNGSVNKEYFRRKLSDQETANKRATGQSLASQQTWYEYLQPRNDLKFNNFNLPGGLVTVNARQLPVGGWFILDGHSYPVPASGSLTIERQLPTGEHKLAVTIVEANAATLFETVLTSSMAENYFFMLGLADLTVGKNSISGGLESSQQTDGFDDELFVDGRVAFYLKGKVKGKYLLTAQLDTGEDDIADIFKDLDRREPGKLFKRIDPDRYYPVYGDDSTISRDVDSQGKFYLRLDWDQSSVLWGNYNSSFSGTELATFRRGLYGAKLDLRSGDLTLFGDQVATLKAFIAQPDALAGHDELEGTGGSLYYLSQQDLVLGSAKVSVVVRERDSLRIRQQTDLIEGRDYEIDEFQGRIILHRPLSSHANKTLLTIIRDTPLEGDRVVLTVDYEYVPKISAADKRVTGGLRLKRWYNKHVGLGASYIQEQNGDVDYMNRALDLTLKASKSSYINIEAGQTDARQNITSRLSVDGGLSYQRQNSRAVDGLQGDAAEIDGTAIVVNAVVDLADISRQRFGGNIGAWYRNLDAGYDSLQYGLDDDEDGRINYGVEGDIHPSENLNVSWRFSSDQFSGQKSTKIGLQADYNINDAIQISTEYQHRQVKTVGDKDGLTASGESQADIIGVKLAYQYDQRLFWHISSQHQLGSDDDASLVTERVATDNLAEDLYGIGFDFRANSKFSLNGEYFTADGADGARLGASYRAKENSHLYLNYITTSQSVVKRGITIGQSTQLTDKISVYQEHRFDVNNSDQQRGNSYGLSYLLRPGWSTDFEMFAGSTEVADDRLDRNAYSVTSRLKKTAYELVNRLEYREDENQQWVTTNRYSLTLSNEWSLLGKIDYSITDLATQGQTQARFAEADLGFAYRPVLANQLNILGVYSYLYDLDPLQQFGASQFDEKSHVVSLEAVYEWNQHFELGAKLAYKQASLRIDRDAGSFFDTKTQLGIFRIRYHLIETWDALAEYRWLEVVEANDRRQGYLAGIERHLGNGIKLGVGYNFTDFNADLRVLDFDSQGWFVNLLYKQ